MQYNKTMTSRLINYKEEIIMKTFDYAKVKDPRYFRDGRLDAPSELIYYLHFVLLLVFIL